MRHSLLLLGLAACGQPDAQVAAAAPAPPEPPKIDPIVKGVPHGGTITKVAITEQADAALTCDHTGGVRLWPSLDASRTPVPVAAVAPDQLALSHVGRDLLATILDEAGSVRLMRLGLDGSVRSDVQLRADVGYEQAIALDDGVLVRSADHVIEWFSAAGESRGKLVADPAWRVQAIAARHGRALAVVFDGTKLQLRWLETYNDRLTWGPTIDLPGTLQADLVALSPSHGRLAVVDTKKTLTVYTLGFAATPLGKPIAVNDPRDVGFIDDDRVAAMGSQLAWWTAPVKPSPDPWAVSGATMPTPSSMQLADGGAVGDGVAVMGFGAALSIVDKTSVHYLGYQEHGVGNVGAAPSSLWVSMTGSHIVWLDDTLAVKREIELRKTENSPWVYATPIDDHHIVRQVPKVGSYAVELVDVDAPDAPVALGTFPNVERIEYAAEANVIGIAEGSKIHRYRFDAERTAVTELPALKTRGSVVQMRLLDPARSGGLTAITLGWSSDDDEDYTMTLYREQGAPQKVRPFRGRLLDFDARGNAIVVNGLALEVRHGNDKVTSFPIDRIGTPVGVSPDGARFAVLSGNDVVVLDDKGTEQWRKPLWGAQQLLFTHDGTRVAVRATGGLVLLDAATGERTAMECGWSFALSSLPPQTNAIASAPVCEDPML